MTKIILFICNKYKLGLSLNTFTGTFNILN